MNAESIVGEFDSSLFSLRKLSSQQRISQLTINGINIDMLNYSATGPFGWLKKGQIDLKIQLQLSHPPPQTLALHLRKSTEASPTADKTVNLSLNASGTSSNLDIPTINALSVFYPRTDKDELINQSSASTPSELFIYTQLTLRNIFIQLPSDGLHMLPSLGFMSKTLARPVISYLNSHTSDPHSLRSATPPIVFKMRIPVDPNFNGAWSFIQCSLLDHINESMGQALLELVSMHFRKQRRIIGAAGATHSQIKTIGSSDWRDTGGQELDGLHAGQQEPHGLNIVWRVSIWAMQSVSKAVVGFLSSGDSQLSHYVSSIQHDDFYTLVVWGSRN